MKTICRHKYFYAFQVLVFLFFYAGLYGQENPQASKSSIFELFSGDDYAEFDLTYNFEELEQLKKTDNYLKGVLEFEDKNKAVQKWDIELKARGKYRRRICDFPPLKIKFDKKDLSDNGFKKDNDMKLVTHCLDDYAGKENVLREYLAYQLYQLHSEHYYRTQLVKITYRDSESNQKIRGIGILLEDNETLERRLEAEECDNCFSLPQDTFYQDNLHTTSLFQYMIGNSDWSITMSRNVDMLKCKNEEKFYIIPYDFDFSGLVNASYALPNSDFQQKSIRDRVFMGFYKDVNELKPFCSFFLSKKEEVLDFVKDFKELPSFSRRDIKEFLESFYDALEDGTFFAELSKG